MPLFYHLPKRPSESCDLYRNEFRSIYKLKTIYIQIENDLYIYRKPFVYRSLSSLLKVMFLPEKHPFLTFLTSKLRCI
ncbi:hypothetical protein CS546_00220 [Porphyromonas gingivalis]|nr:hypothetical protein CS546_00220 [Porphyromonas gingivalis]ATR96761.1 hypothetical protein CS548_06600 [Porphyromonas gingivalis]ERJ67697.1 hypothetical protein HMPREF1554_00886 [Porphyromonas gingivalis F0569]